MSISPVNSLGPTLPLRQADTSTISTTEKNFSDFVTSSINQVNKSQLDGDMAIEKLHSGEAQNLHDVMIAVEQADISLRMLVQIRNKALQAYEEVMRMQI